MSFVVVVPPTGYENVRRVPWASSSPLQIFVWVVQLSVGVGSGPLMACIRAALAIWVRKLEIVVPVFENGAPASSADEAMLD